MAAGGMTRKQDFVGLISLSAVLLAGLATLAWLKRPTALRIEETAEPERAKEWDRRLDEAQVVRLNTATIAELERLPRVGPVLAARILEARQKRGGFTRIEDLLEVPGIGPAMLQTLAPKLQLE